MDFETGKSKDVYIGLTHFTAPFLILILATSVSLLFGVAVPLLGIAGVRNVLVAERPVVGGLLAAVVLVAAYFVAELIHYRIISTELINDTVEWKRNNVVVLVSMILGVTVFWVTMDYLR